MLLTPLTIGQLPGQLRRRNLLTATGILTTPQRHKIARSLFLRVGTNRCLDDGQFDVDIQQLLQSCHALKTGNILDTMANRDRAHFICMPFSIERTNNKGRSPSVIASSESIATSEQRGLFLAFDLIPIIGAEAAPKNSTVSIYQSVHKDYAVRKVTNIWRRRCPRSQV